MYRQTSGYKACSIYGFHDAVNIVSTKPNFKCLIRVIAFNAPPHTPLQPKNKYNTIYPCAYYSKLSICMPI